jgi:hypothetical protein
MLLSREDVPNETREIETQDTEKGIFQQKVPSKDPQSGDFTFQCNITSKLMKVNNTRVRKKERSEQTPTDRKSDFISETYIIKKAVVRKCNKSHPSGKCQR